MIHFKQHRVSYSIDFASIPFDNTANITQPANLQNGIAQLAFATTFDETEEVQSVTDDPAFQYRAEEVIPYRSYEVTISSASIGMELESTFQK